MKLRRIALLTSLTATCALGLVGAAPAAATPVWNLDIHHNETNFPPGGTAEYSFDIANIGDTAPAARSRSPSHCRRHHSQLGRGQTRIFLDGVDTPWSCPARRGHDRHLHHHRPDSRHTVSRSLLITVDVAPGAGPDLTATATLSGGGAPEAPPAATARPESGPAHRSRPTSAPNPALRHRRPGFLGRRLLRSRRGHPGAPRRRPPRPRSPSPSTSTRSPHAGPSRRGPQKAAVRQHPPRPRSTCRPGFVGNPTAVGECTPAQLAPSACPASSQVGRADVVIFPITDHHQVQLQHARLFNMAHPRGVDHRPRLRVRGHPVHVKASLDPANNYAITTTRRPTSTRPCRPSRPEVTLWGVPADPSHDSERCHGFHRWLHLPTECSTDHATEALPHRALRVRRRQPAVRSHHYDSWQHIGRLRARRLLHHARAPDTNATDPASNPTSSIEPTGQQANTPDRPRRPRQGRPERKPQRPRHPAGQAHGRHPARGDELLALLRRRAPGLLLGPDRARHQRPGRLPRRLADRRSDALHAAVAQSRSRDRCTWQRRATTPSAPSSPSTWSSTTPKNAAP